PMTIDLACAISACGRSRRWSSASDCHSRFRSPIGCRLPPTLGRCSCFLSPRRLLSRLPRSRRRSTEIRRTALLSRRHASCSWPCSHGTAALRVHVWPRDGYRRYVVSNVRCRTRILSPSSSVSYRLHQGIHLRERIFAWFDDFGDISRDAEG